MPMPMPSLPSVVLLSLFCAGALPGQEPVPRAVAAAAGAALTQVLWDAPADGVRVALAPGYKAIFAAGGAVTFVPYLGAAAPRNFPITFRLESIQRGGTQLRLEADAKPSLDGARVSYAHAVDVCEVWEARELEVEQTFTLTSLAGVGDLVVTLAVESELACVDTADGLLFEVPGLGGVVYGDVLAFDAFGAEVRAPSRWRDGHIELRIPAWFVAQARGALTIDPVVRSFSVASGGEDQRRAAIAFDQGSDRWLAAFTRVFSVVDADVLARRYTRDGVFLDEVAVAVGLLDSDNAAVAAFSPPSGVSFFLVAWDEGRVANRTVLGRRRTPFSTTQGNTFTIRAAAGVSCERPVVGGSTATGSGADVFGVVWEQTGGVLGFARVDGTDTVLSSGLFTASPAVATDPAITRAHLPGDDWIVAFRVAVGTGHEIHARVLPVLDLPLSAARVVMATARHGPPSIAGSNQDTLVVATRATPLGAGDVFAAHLRVSGRVVSVLAEHNLSAREPGASRTADQRDPVVAFDGCRFAYAYLEQVGSGSDYDAYVATCFVASGAAPVFQEGHHPLVTGARMEEAVAFACVGETGGGVGDALAVVEQVVTANDHDLLGAQYRVASPLASLGFRNMRCFIDRNIAADAVPVLGGRVRVSSPVAIGSLPLMLVGLESPAIQLCSSCRLGVNPILLAVPGASIELPIPCNPNLVGAQIAVQNIAVNHPQGCDPFGLTLAIFVSDAMVLTIG